MALVEEVYTKALQLSNTFSQYSNISKNHKNWVETCSLILQELKELQKVYLSIKSESIDLPLKFLLQKISEFYDRLMQNISKNFYSKYFIPKTEINLLDEQNQGLISMLDQVKYFHLLGNTKEKSGLDSMKNTEAKEFWMKNFGLIGIVSWEIFLKAFEKHFGYSFLEVELSFRRLLDSNNTNTVTPFDLETFLDWFGPLNKCLVNFLPILLSPFVHLTYSSNDAVEHLKGRSEGTFLLRTSFQKSKKLAISRVDSNEIVHRYCHFQKNGGWYFKKEQKFPSLFELLLSEVNANKLKFSCCKPSTKEKYGSKTYGEEEEGVSPKNVLECPEIIEAINKFKKLTDYVTHVQYQNDSEVKTPIPTQPVTLKEDELPSSIPIKPIPMKAIQKFSPIGKGNFGVVWLAKYSGQEVALKELKECNKLEFIKEAQILCSLNNPSILRCFGFYSDSEGEYFVTEYVANGSLEELLSNDPSISVYDKLEIAISIANGMQYLHSENIIHRDLAARNILIEHISDKNRRKYKIKIADFGLSRSLTNSEYETQNKDFPIHWTALEILSQDLNYDKALIWTPSADIWSYGVVLWELMNPGASPYEDLNLDFEKLLSYLSIGRRLPRNSCPNDIFEVMEQCWAENPQKRISWEAIIQNLKMIKDKLLVEEKKYLQNNNNQTKKINSDSAYF